MPILSTDRSRVLVALDVTPRLWNTDVESLAMHKLALVLQELKHRKLSVQEVRAAPQHVHAIVAAPPDDVSIANLQKLAHAVRDAVDQQESDLVIDKTSGDFALVEHAGKQLRLEPDSSLRKRLHNSAWRFESSDHPSMIDKASGKDLDTLASLAGKTRRSIATGVDLLETHRRAVEDNREIPNGLDLAGIIARRKHLALLHARSPTYVLVTQAQFDLLRLSSSGQFMPTLGMRGSIHQLFVEIAADKFEADCPMVL